MKAPLNLDHDSAKEPINKLVLNLIKNAVSLQADVILLGLDLELHLKVEKESDVIRGKYRRPTFYEAVFKRRFKDFFCFGKSTIEKMFFELGQLPNALKVTYVINGVEEAAPSIRGCLFEDITQILLNTAGISPKTRGEVSALIETIKPASKWMLESKNLTRCVELKRIREV